MSLSIKVNVGLLPETKLYNMVVFTGAWDTMRLHLTVCDKHSISALAQCWVDVEQASKTVVQQ